MGKNILDGYLDQGTNNSVYYEKYLEETENNKTNTMVYPFLMDDVKTATYNTNLIWKNDFEEVKGTDPNLLVEARKNSQNNPYEMDCMSRLYQSKMKVQCRTYKTAWETDNEKLSELANTFSSSQTSIEMQGDTANNIWELFSDYCTIIQCMQMGIFFDLEDNNALYNKLGDVDLDGSVILHGIESARTNYSIECTARDNSISAAISTSDEDFSRWLWSEARRHGDLAHSYYDEWMHYEDLKREYEEINAFSMKFYLTGVEYRTLAQEGMDILATAYDGSGNYVVPAGFAGWRTQFEEKNKVKLTEYASSKWKNENGEWDMEALEAEISIEDPSVISDEEYLALCYAFESMEIEDKEKFISMSFCVIDEDYQSATSTKLNISPVYQRMADIYKESLNINLNSDEEISSADENKIFSYNLLYTYTYIQPSYVINTMDMKGGKEGIDIRANVNIQQSGNDYTVQLYRDDIDFESPEYTLYGYSKNLDTTIEKEMNLYANKQRKDVWGDVRNEGGEILVGVVVGKAAGYVEDKVLDSVPIVNTLYDCYNDYDSLKKAYDDAQANNEAWSNIMTMSDIRSTAAAYNIGGSVIAADGVVCVTAYDYTGNGIELALDTYNERYEENAIDYGTTEEFMHRVVYEADYAAEIRGNDDLYLLIKETGGSKEGETVHF